MKKEREPREREREKRERESGHWQAVQSAMQSARAQANIRTNHLDIFTTRGGMGEAFQRQIRHPHWKRVEAEDAEMKISAWVSRKRKLMWMARFGAEIAKHNALMISRSQNIADCE